MEICLFCLQDRKALGNSGVGNCIDLSQVAEGIYQVVMDSTTSRIGNWKKKLDSVFIGFGPTWKIFQRGKLL